MLSRVSAGPRLGMRPGRAGAAEHDRRLSLRVLEERYAVCRLGPNDAVPPGLQVLGPLDFALAGALASLTGPLARAGISVFVLSTFDTDYLLVRERDLETAAAVLSRHGHWMLE